MTIALVAITDYVPNKPIGAVIPKNRTDIVSETIPSDCSIGTETISHPEPVPSKPVLTSNSDGSGEIVIRVRS